MGRVKMNIPPRAHKPPMIHQNKFKVGRYFLYGNFDECKNAHCTIQLFSSKSQIRMKLCILKKIVFCTICRKTRAKALWVVVWNCLKITY